MDGAECGANRFGLTACAIRAAKKQISAEAGKRKESGETEHFLQ
jgi:hypothetical protein